MPLSASICVCYPNTAATANLVNAYQQNSAPKIPLPPIKNNKTRATWLTGVAFSRIETEFLCKLIFSEVKSLIWSPLFSKSEIQCLLEKIWQKRTAKMKKTEFGLQLNKSRKHLPGGSNKAAEHPVLFRLQSNSTALPIGTFAIESLSEMQRSYASCVTIRIQTALPSADCTTFCCQQRSFTFRKLGSSVPPTISFCLWSTISALEKKSIKLWCSTETRTTHLPRQIINKLIFILGEVACLTDATAKPCNERWIIHRFRTGIYKNPLSS